MYRSEFPGCTRWRTKKFNSISPRAGWKHIKYWLNGPALPVEKNILKKIKYNFQKNSLVYNMNFQEFPNMEHIYKYLDLLYR